MDFFGVICSRPYIYAHHEFGNVNQIKKLNKKILSEEQKRKEKIGGKMTTVGGIQDVGNENDLHIQNLARFAVDEHNKKEVFFFLFFFCFFLFFCFFVFLFFLFVL